MLTQKQIDECGQGLDQLKKPILPLVRLAQMLYLTGPFDTFAPLLDEFTEPVETGGISYKKPGIHLLPYLDLLEIFERIKTPRSPARILLNEQLEPMDPLDALDSWVAQEVVKRELETINSQLCRPCNCTLCCIGPDDTLNQDFFEIPLQPEEASLFKLNRIDSPETRLTTSHSEPPLLRNKRPFYQTQSALYHWLHGWSLILPRRNHCPNLDPTSGGCLIYPKRPDVCRLGLPLRAGISGGDRPLRRTVRTGTCFQEEQGVILPESFQRSDIFLIRFAESCSQKRVPSI